jgi:hypothetical protein
MRRVLRRGILGSLTTFALLMSLPVPAGCMSDCRDEYEAAVEDCRVQYDDPDDADSLRICLDDAKAAYEDCAEECRT